MPLRTLADPTDLPNLDRAYAIERPALGLGAGDPPLYTRSIGWNGLDPSLKKILKHLKRTGTDFGTEVVFDFCPGNNQFAVLTQAVPRDLGNLPMAISLVTPVDERGVISAGNAVQASCFTDGHDIKR